MGKRKRRADNNKAPPPPPPPPSDSIPQAPREDLQTEPRSYDRAESSAAESQASIMVVVDSSLKKPPGHQPPLNQNHVTNRSILLRHSRHPFGRHYSRRSSSNHFDASSSHGKGTPMYDPKLSVKLECKDLSNIPYRENRNRIFQKQERIRASSLSEGALSGDARKMECTICHKRLRKNPFISESSISSTDLSVVAVLFCGHVYHADCLDQKTNHEDQQDPPCPMCVSLKLN